MIELDNGKWAVRLKAESVQDSHFLECLNKPEPIGYLMFNGEFLVMKNFLLEIMEKYHGNHSASTD